MSSLSLQPAEQSKQSPAAARGEPDERPDRAPQVPRLIPGVELLGEYEGSGYREPHFIVRRPDQQVVQLSRLLHLVASEVDGHRDAAGIAERVSARLGQPVSAANVEYLIERKLEPLGVASCDGAAVDDHAACAHRPTLSLAARRTLIPPAAVNRIASVLQHLFAPIQVAQVLIALLVADWWLITHASMTKAMLAVIAQPWTVLVAMALLLGSTLFHEFGHAAGCVYGGAKPGHIGMGIYLVWPALYTNVTDAYRLGRAGRLRTDLGGIYFNIVFILTLTVAFVVTEWQPLVLVILFAHLEIVQQLLPVVRLDGYFILGDMVGVPDLFGYMAPILRGLVPGRHMGEKAKALTRKARAVIRCWALVTAVALTSTLVYLGWSAPRMVRSAVVGVQRQGQNIAQAVSEADALGVLLGVVSIFSLLIPLVGAVIILYRTLVGAGRVVLARLPARLRPQVRLHLPARPRLPTLVHLPARQGRQRLPARHRMQPGAQASAREAHEVRAGRAEAAAGAAPDA